MLTPKFEKLIRVRVRPVAYVGRSRRGILPFRIAIATLLHLELASRQQGRALLFGFI